MNRKSASLILLALSFGVGVITADYHALLADTAPVKPNVMLVIVLLLAIGVYGWYRIVKSAAEQNEWQEREFRLDGRATALNADTFQSER